MKINPYIPVQQVYSAKKTNAARKAGSVGRMDGVEISNIGKEIQVAKQAVANAPDVRAELVEPIKAAVKNGTYAVSAEKFADKLIAAVGQI